MTRKEIKEGFSILQAIAEGKIIQYQSRSGDWKDIASEDWDYNQLIHYRIKPEEAYRPFKSAEECWQEMQKHQPLGWVKEDKRAEISHIVYVNPHEIETHDNFYNYQSAFENFVFVDGTIFGIKETNEED